MKQQVTLEVCGTQSSGDLQSVRQDSLTMAVGRHAITRRNESDGCVWLESAVVTQRWGADDCYAKMTPRSFRCRTDAAVPDLLNIAIDARCSALVVRLLLCSDSHSCDSRTELSFAGRAAVQRWMSATQPLGLSTFAWTGHPSRHTPLGRPHLPLILPHHPVDS